MRLTKSAIDRARYEGNGKAPFILWDDEVKGFGLRLYPSGQRSFLIDYRLSGRQRRVVLGRYGVLTLDQARRMAHRKLAEVLSGCDPAAAKAQARRGETLDAVFEAFLERHSKRHKRSWAEDERRYRKHIHPALGKMKIRAVTRQDVTTLHSRIGEEHPREANNVLALLGVMFTFASRNGFLPEEHPNPSRGIQKFKEGKRDRWLRPGELPTLAEAIAKEENPYLRGFFWLCLLTGCRKSELLRAQWSDIDFERAELRLPETKRGDIHYVPLSEPALEILGQLPREQGNPYIFCGQRAGEHLKNINPAWHRVRAEAGIPDIRVHDLRRTVGSWLATSGYSLEMIGKLLDHSHPSTTKIYAHLADDPLKQAVEEHGEKIMDFAKIKKRADEKTG